MSIELIKSTREVTVAFLAPGESEPRTRVFHPCVVPENHINRVPSEEWELMKQKAPVQGYLATGIFEHVNGGRAQGLFDGDIRHDEPVIPPLQRAAEVMTKTGDTEKAREALERAMDEVKNPVPQNQKKR